VSAALLAVVSAGVYAGIDGPTKFSGQGKARAAATNLAQADQEHMRAMRFADLQNYAPPATTQTVDGVQFTIASRADWVDDSDATAGCTVPNNQGDYLKLTSTVSWKGGGNGNPTVVTSLLAPPVNDSTNGTGNIVVTLTDQAGAPVAGIPVTINGRTNATKSTDAQGCAVFTNVLAGNYTATMSSPGYVDNLNVPNPSMQAAVSAGQTVQLQHSYAKAAQVTVNFVTDQTNTTAASWTKASVGGGALLTPKVLSSGTAVTSLNTGKTLYPSPSGQYVGWAGGCADPGSPYDAAAPVTPGNITTVNVILPVLTLKVPTTGLPSAPRIVVKPSDPSCTDTFTVPPATTVAGTSGNPSQYVWTMRLPRAKYSLCADLLSNRTANPFTISNQAQAGTTAQMGVTTNTSGQPTGATANDGSGLQSTPITAGSCPP